MNRYALVLLPSVVLLGASSGVVAQEGDPPMRNYETPGNLESFEPLGCVGIESVRNTNTPADLVPAVGACIAAGDYEHAVPLFMVAGAYASFDMERVADRTAHQAFAVLRINVLGGAPPSRLEAFQAHASEVMEPGGAQLQALCAAVRDLGPPAYYPTYMIQHGVGVFLGDDGAPLLADFDEASTWELILDEYLHCPASAGGD